MTIPTRPAPAPPSAAIAAAGANASLERLRIQLEQQQQQQQQQSQTQRQRTCEQKLSIKLPPPLPKPTTNSRYYQQTRNNISEDGGSSITRKFPVARYAPATNWDDSPFENFKTTTTNENGYGKKAPPPRPPPPKINARKCTAPAPPISPRPPTSVNILSSIFNRKKQAKAAQNSRIYGLSAGVSGQNNNNNIYNNSSSGTGSGYTAWNTTTTTSSYNYSSNAFDTYKSMTTTTTQASAHEAQLISFDSPPSSPTFTQKSNSDCVSVDSFSSDSNFGSPNNGSASQPESGFEDDFGTVLRSRQCTTSPLDPWETLETLGSNVAGNNSDGLFIGTAPVRNFNTMNSRLSNDNPLCNGKSLLPPAPSLQMPTIIKPKISQKPKAPKPPAFMANKQTQQQHSLAFQQMPTYAVNQASSVKSNGAPSVSLLDVISGKADPLLLSRNSKELGAAVDNGPPYGIALYDFEGLEEGDLSFRENEKIYLLEQVSEEWYRGRTRSGCEGIFPVNYIDIKIPLAAVGNNATTTESDVENQWPTARSLYNFPADVEGDLALRENDLVTIYYKINDDWLYGEVNGRLGQFPANFLDQVPANVPPMPQN